MMYLFFLLRVTCLMQSSYLYTYMCVEAQGWILWTLPVLEDDYFMP